MLTPKPKIVFIAAHSRSGSTILDRALAQIDGAFSVGEMRYIWQRSIIENQLCGCSAKFYDCSVWKQVIANASLDTEFASRMCNIALNVDRFKLIPRISYPLLRTSSFEKMLGEYIEGIRRVYVGINETIKPSFIVDSSKSASYGMILKQIPEIDLHIVHLVRDSRAVAFSRMKKKKRPEIHWKDEYTAYTPPYKTALQWDIINYALGYLGNNSSYSLVRYEDFMSNPKSTIKKIIGELGLTSTVSYINGSTIKLNIDHTVSGNPMRFKNGNVALKYDERWKTGLSEKHRFLLDCLTWPMQKKYHYL